MHSHEKVLIVDDDPSSRFLLEDLIAEWGYAVQAVENGEEAWSVLCCDDAPQLAVVDWMMPGLSGPDLCRKIKERLSGPFVYLILLTSKTDKDDVVKGLDAGADDFISKPVGAEELRSRLAVGERMVHYEKALKEKERAVRLEVYRALTDLAEARDNETGQHLKRLSLYVTILAEHLGLPKAFITDLQTFIPLHDIGKVGIPDSILLAPRRLSKDEFEIMKTHASLGYDILKGKPTLEMAAIIARSHHEKWNGGGYPDGLAGEEIPLPGRLSALADVYDALRTRRPYKEPWSHQEAAALLRAEAGQQFDPRVVEAFEAHEDRFEEVAERYREDEEAIDARADRG